MSIFGTRISGFFSGGTSGGGGGGTVVGVTGTLPISSSGGTTPDISISQASGSTDGYLSSGDWTTFNNKVGGSGTATRVAFFSASGTLSSNTNLYWDNTNSRLGIGTTTPSVRLQVTGSDAIINLVKAGKGNGSKLRNTAFGTNALDVTNADNNTAIGYQALKSNTDGTLNTAIGREALTNNTEGVSNVAVGNGTLSTNTIGLKNVAIGDSVLLNCTQGARNTAVGDQSLYALTEGVSNTAIGDASGIAITTGINNTFLGKDTGTLIITGNDNTFIGRGMSTLGDDSSNLLIGAGGSVRIKQDSSFNFSFYADEFIVKESGTENPQGLLLDIGNLAFTYGQIDDGTNPDLHHYVDGTPTSEQAYFKFGGNRIGYEFDFGTTKTYKFGDFSVVYATGSIEIDTTNSTMLFKGSQSTGSTTFEANTLVLTGANLQTATPPTGTTPTYIKVTINSVPYLIEAFTP
jgi:hypothetical protein